MAVFVKNDTVSNKTWVGVQIAAAAYHLIEMEELPAWQVDATFLAAVAAGDAILATADDGLEDIDVVAEGLTVLRDESLTHIQTLVFRSRGLVDDAFLQLTNNVASNVTPHIPIFGSELKGIDFMNAIDSANFDIEIENDGVEVFTWEVRSGRFGSKTDGLGGVMFDPSDTIGIFIRNAGTPIPRDLIVSLLMLRIEDQNQTIINATLP